MDVRKLSTILALKINKTDKNDARGIAEALRSGMYTRVHYKPQDSVEKSILLVFLFKPTAFPVQEDSYTPSCKSRRHDLDSCELSR